MVITKKSQEPKSTFHSGDLESYRAGRFVFTADDRDVIVTKDTKTGIVSVSMYTYRNHEEACEMAWKMACRQMRA